jgi:uncharacterized protein YfaS (alpha-2-macroglobulin family)
MPDRSQQRSVRDAAREDEMYENHVGLRAAALWGAVLSVSCGLAACGSKSKKPAELTVTSFAPDGVSYEPAPSIQLQFDAPVVPEEQVGAKLAAAPLALEPAVALEAHWVDRQTLVAVPAAELAPSTRYRVALRGPLAGRTNDFSFSFVSMPLAITGVGGETLDRLPPTPRLALQLNQKVAASAVLEHCRLRAPGSKDAIALSTPDPKLQETAIEISPKTPLTQGGDYELVCEGLTGVGGNAPLAEPFVQALHTYPAFSVIEIQPTGGAAVPADDVEIAIGFANPVSLEDVRAHLSMEPRTPGIAEGWLDGSGSYYRVTLNLETTTDYTLRIAKGLKDIHGQALAAPVEHRFTTTDARPRLSLETGIYALETVATGYPVWSRNVSTYDVECAPVGKAQVTKVLSTNIDYTGWYNSDESIDWKKLGLKKKDQTVTIEKAKNKWHIDHLDFGKLCGPASRARGIYLAQLRSEDIVPDPNQQWDYRPFQRVLANVTDLGVLLKVGDGSGLVWVTRLSDGQPVAGASVSTYTKDGKRTFQGTSGADGVVRLPGRTQLLPPSKKKDDEEGEYGYGYGYGAGAERVIAVVETGDDLAVVDGNWSDGIEAWNFGVSQDRSGDKVAIRGFIQSDRGIYRPGETVHFKGLVREVAVGKPPAVPQQRAIKVAVESSRGSTVLEKTLTLSSFGGFHFDLPLTADAPVGDYHVKATLGATTFRESFSVEEFRAVTFEIAAAAAKRHMRLREPIQVDVSARYLFGEPVAGGKVKWSAERRTHELEIPSQPGFAFSDYVSKNYDYWWHRSSEESTTSVGDGKGVMDKQGKIRLAINDATVTGEETDPQDYLIEISVEDPTNQTVQKSVVVTGHRSDHYLGLRTTEYVTRVEEPLALEVVAVTPTGEPVAARATLSAVRSSWECTYETSSFRSYPRCERKETLVTSREVAIPASGPKKESLRVDKPGSYVLRLEGVDARGNKLAASTYAWVTGAGGFDWSDSEESRMNLIASKPSYEPGETARLVPQSSLQGALALVTVERGGILDARVQRMASASEGIDVALSDVHAPNVFASVALVRGRTGPKDEQRPRLQMGVTELKVSSASRRLAVKIETDKDSYQPGEMVRGTIRVTSGNAPVRAEVSLSAADEGVLQLIAYQTPDPMQRFYANWGLGIDNATNWTHLARLNDPSDVDMMEGADGGGAADAGRVRSRFVSSAYWAPALVTDQNGQIAFEFESPDNLTAFRLMAVAADEGARFGSGERRITIKKPLLAKPVLPRFFTAGDRGEVGVVIHNYTGAAGAVEVTAKAEGATLQKSAETVQIAAGDSARVRFPVRVGDGKEATFEFSARMGAHADALRMGLPINRPYIHQRKVLARGELGTAGNMRLEVPLSWDAELIARDSVVTVSVDRTGMSELEPSLRYLIEYPYGCLEQTLSRFIPLTKVKDLARSLELDELSATKLDDFVRAGAAKVARHQDLDSGHFSLWPGGETYPHLTVYALYGLNEAKRAGVRVDAQAMNRGLEAMREWARSADRKLGESGEAGTMAMAAFLLAELGQPDTGLNARLFEAHRNLPRYAQAFLLRALHLAKAPAEQRQAVEAALLAGADGSGATVILRETKPDDYYMDSDVRSTAIALSALLVADPGHALVPKLVEGLLRAQSHGRWSNTQENLYALVALADYARRQAQGRATVTVSRGTERELRRRVQGHEALVFRRSVRNLDKGPLVLETDGPVRYLVTVDEARKIKADAPLAQGFTVAREYLDPTTGRPLARFRAGGLVHVKVTVKLDESQHYVAVVDPLPAGLEAVNPRFATVTTKVDQDEEDDGNWWDDIPDTWTYRELRDDEARAFADHLSAGEHTFEYLARATLPGQFLVLPARAEAMYKPDRNGRSAAVEIDVRR